MRHNRNPKRGHSFKGNLPGFFRSGYNKAVFDFVIKTRAGQVLLAAALIGGGAAVVSNLNKKKEDHSNNNTPGITRSNTRLNHPINLSNQASNILQQIKQEQENNFKYKINDPDRLRDPLTRQEKRDRTIKYPNGVKVLKGLCGGSFYIFTQEDEKHKNIQLIRRKLSEVPEYSYVRNDEFDVKQRGFNFGKYAIKEGSSFLIPSSQQERTIGDKELLVHIDVAIQEMLNHHTYGDAVEKMIRICGRERLMSLALASAKKECGPFPIGYYQLFRSENFGGKTIYSYSIYHILHDGHGKNALSNLGLSITQTLHPINATKWWLAFVAEKSGLVDGDEDKARQILAIKEINWVPYYSRFYNGPKYKPDYPRDLYNYFADCLSYLNGANPSRFGAEQTLLKEESANRREFQQDTSPVTRDNLPSKIQQLMDERREEGVLPENSRLSLYVAEINKQGKIGNVLASFNSKTSIPVASMNKVAVAVAYFHVVKAKKAKPSQDDLKLLQAMLAKSSNTATNKIMQRVAQIAKGKNNISLADASDYTERLLKSRYPNYCSGINLQVIPKSGRAYKLLANPEQHARLLAAISRGDVPGSKTIESILGSQKAHKRIYKYADADSKNSVADVFGKTGSTAYTIGDGIIFELKDGLKVVMVGVINQPTSNKSAREQYGTFMKKSGQVLGELFDLTQRTLEN